MLPTCQEPPEASASSLFPSAGSFAPPAAGGVSAACSKSPSGWETLSGPTSSNMGEAPAMPSGWETSAAPLSSGTKGNPSATGARSGSPAAPAIMADSSPVKAAPAKPWEPSSPAVPAMPEGSEWITTGSSLVRSLSVSGFQSSSAPSSPKGSPALILLFLGLFRTFSTTTGSEKIPSAPLGSGNTPCGWYSGPEETSSGTLSGSCPPEKISC